VANTVLLINLPPAPGHLYNLPGASYPATGLMLVGTLFKGRGYEIRVIDGATHPDYPARVLSAVSNDTAMIGFSVMTSQVPMALGLSRRLKAKHPGVPVVWGGIHPILFPEQTIADDAVDIAVLGDGAATVYDLCDYLAGLKPLQEVKGIAFKTTEGVQYNERSRPDDFDILPHLDFEILGDVETYLRATSVYQREINEHRKLRFMPMLTGLGCCYKCSFCINVFLKKRYRFRSASSIIAEVKRLQQTYQADAFVFYDEDFLINKPRLLELLDLIEQHDLRFYWRIWTRVDHFRQDYLNDALIARMERCGVRSIAMGAESGSQKILDMIQKGIKLPNIQNSARALAETKITPRYSFIVGLEGEAQEDAAKTYRLCADLMATNPRVDIAGPFIFRYYPGSPIFNRLIQKYHIYIPGTLEQWDAALSSEGYLRIDHMPWLWTGFSNIVEALNADIAIANKLIAFQGFWVGLIRKLIIWRLRTMNVRYPLEVFLYENLKRIRAVYYWVSAALRKPSFVPRQVS
jgi:anaerobic magnesium-protoporphyrin IX monomethyl ester cyclase